MYGQVAALWWELDLLPVVQTGAAAMAGQKAAQWWE